MLIFRLDKQLIFNYELMLDETFSLKVFFLTGTVYILGQ